MILCFRYRTEFIGQSCIYIKLFQTHLLICLYNCRTGTLNKFKGLSKIKRKGTHIFFYLLFLVNVRPGLLYLFFFMQQSNAMGDKYSFHLSCLFLLASYYTLLTPYIPTYYSTYPYVNDRLSFYERQEFPFFITDEMARCGASLP